MTEHHQEGDHKHPASEKQADLVERKSEHKSSSEASGGMVEHNKIIVKGIQEKRESRKSGATKNGFNSADSLLPHENPNKAKSHKSDKTAVPHQVTEGPGRQPKLEAPPHKAEIEPKHEPSNLDRVKEAAGKALQTVSGGGLYESGNVLKSVRDGIAPVVVAEKTRFVPAGTPLEIRGHVYPLNELTAQGLDRATDVRDKPKENPLAGVSTVVGRDGVKRLDGHFQPESKAKEPELADVIGAMGKALEPVTNAISHFNSESTKALHNIVEQGKDAVGMSPPHAPKPIHVATGDGSTLPKSIQNPGDAAHLGIGATVGFTKAVNEMMPGLTPRGAIEGAIQAGKQVAALAQAHSEHETNMHKNPIRTMLQDAITGVKMYNGAVDWANKRSQTENFAERGQDIGKASPDVMMASEIIFIARSGHLITPRDAIKQQLETKTPEELERLGIQRTMADKLKPEDIVNPIDRNATQPEKVRQLQNLSAENQPLIDDFGKHIDSKYRSFSYGEPKEPSEILKKAQRLDTLEGKPWFNVEHIRDSQRFTTVVDNLDSLPAIAKDLKESSFQVINPDTAKMEANKRGWRMMAFDLRAPNGQLVEYQVLPKEMYKAGQETHPIHEKWREKSTKSLTKAEEIEMNKDMAKCRSICTKAWKAYQDRTGQTADQINSLLKQVDKLFEEANH